ncbi:MAG: lysophospholipid acyltransferase family protein [Deltaproteobacteria bacterium]|nr:lysophospholipid acyltransferase family protein [Deltaproteobacteria bacterium]
MKSGAGHYKVSLQQELWIKVAGVLGAMLLRGIDAFSRWDIRGTLKDALIWKTKQPVLVVFWHGQQLYMPGLYRRTGRYRGSAGMFALASQHRDGRIISYASKLLGIGSVVGSSSHGGMEAGLELVHTLKQGFDVAMTPDGPRGPQFKVKPGVLRIAQMTGALLYPVAASTSRGFCFRRSWDKMVLPLPFGKVVGIAGEGIRVPAEASPEEFERLREKLEQCLNDLTKEADALCGR